MDRVKGLAAESCRGYTRCVGTPLLALLLFLPSARADDFGQLPDLRMQPAAAAAGPQAQDPSDCDADPPPISGNGDAAGKIEGKQYPAVFEAWQPADGLSPADDLQLHQLVWKSPEAFGFKGNSPYQGLITQYTAPAAGINKGPNTVALAEIRWYDGHYDPSNTSQDYFPGGGPWWMLKGDGTMTPASTTLTQPMYRLNYKDACFQKQVVLKCQAAVKAGLDGCMFDWWHPDAAMVQMLARVRRAIGDALIIVNSNGSVPSDLSDVNGVFTEGFGASFWPHGQGYAQVPYPSPEAWQYLIQDLKTLEKGARPPRINAIEGWGDAVDERYLRALTTLVLVYSNAYVLYSRPNGTHPNHDHWHEWDAFWTQDLGAPADPQPRDPPLSFAGGVVYRRFSNGIAVYNPTSVSASVPAELLDGLTRSHRLGELAPGTDVEIPAGDGDILVR